MNLVERKTRLSSNTSIYLLRKKFSSLSVLCVTMNFFYVAYDLLSTELDLLKYIKEYRENSLTDMNFREVNIEMNNFILLVDPKVLSIAVIEENEQMVDLKDQNIILFGSSPEIPNNQDYTKLRQTVYEKLCMAQKFLPKNLQFCIYEGYRSLSLQQFLFDQRFKTILSLHSDWSDEQIFEETIKMVSPVINRDGSQNIPPHSTGGAIDIYLVDQEGNFIDMGIHPKDWMTDKDGSLSKTDSKAISKQAQENRKIMSHALKHVGFINYPAEYWHWSYGDKYWAYHTKNPHAIYNSILTGPA